MSEKDGGGHSHYFDYEGAGEGDYWKCKLCTKWIHHTKKDENCPGMTKEDRKRIREREKQQKELMDESI